jgi:hypothetical protein
MEDDRPLLSDCELDYVEIFVADRAAACEVTTYDAAPD